MSIIWNNKTKALIALGSALVISEVVSYLYDLYLGKKKKKVRRRSIPTKNGNMQLKQVAKEKAVIKIEMAGAIMTEFANEDDRWNTAIFFPDYFPQRPNSATQKVIWYLQQAKKTMKICMYTSSFKILEEAVFNAAKEKGVDVMAVTNVPRTVHIWKRHGIRIREKPKLIRSAFSNDIFVDLMHHKFIIIDDQAVLGGSLNWTISGVCENRENVVITNNPGIVKKFVHEFGRIWELSEPVMSSKYQKKDNKPQAVKSHKKWKFPMGLP